MVDRVVVTASEIPYMTFEVNKLPSEIGLAPTMIRANTLALMIIGENRYNIFTKVD